VTESAASVPPTKPPAAKPQRKAATNASGAPKGRGGGKKSSSTARSTPAAEDATVVADDGSLILTPDDFISLSKDDQKRKIQTIFTDLGIQDITKGIPSSKANNLRACLPLSQADFQKFLKQWVPGYTEKSNDILTLADHLRKAVFPAPSLALIPAGKKDANTKDDVSLRSTYLHICGVPPQSSNGWSQNILMKGIKKQLDSEIDGGDYHYTRLTDNELIDKIQRCDGKKITIKKRLKLVKESWKRDHPGSDFDYTTSTANASHGRSVPVGAGVPSMASVGAPPVQAPTAGAPAAAEANTDQNRDQPHPNASCITPAPARHSSNQGHGQRAEVASTLDEAPNTEDNSSQAEVSARDILHAINTGNQAQRETNEVFRVQFSQQNEQIAGLQQTQNAQGTTIAQHGQQLTAHDATFVQHDQRISATEVAQATQKKVMAEAIGMAQVALLLTSQKASKDKKGLLGRNSDPLQRARTGNLFDSPPTRSNGTDIEGNAAAGGGPFQGVQKDLFADANTTTNGNGNA